MSIYIKVSQGVRGWMRGLAVLVLVTCLTACVTTTNSPFSNKANADEAIDKYVALGLEYIKRDDYGRARKHLERALELDENNAPALASLGLIHHREGENKLAEENFLSALDADPTYTRGRTYYAAFLFSEQRYQDAKTQFTQAAQDVKFASRAQIYTNIALCNIKLGNSEEAISAYEKTLRLDRTNGRALSGITELYIETDRYAKASRTFNQLLRVIATQGLKHSPQSLWQGIRIAHHFGSVEQMNSFATLLEELYPSSGEYETFQVMKASGAL